MSARTWFLVLCLCLPAAARAADLATAPSGESLKVYAQLRSLHGSSQWAVTGSSVDWFFNEYVCGTEVPAYDFQYALTPAPGGEATLQCTLTQSGVSDQFEMRVPIYLAVGKNVQRLGFIRIKGSTAVPVKVPLLAVPDRISIDEYHDLLAVEHR